MNRNSVLQLLHSPFGMTEKDRKKMEDLLDKYPFFTAGHMLCAKNADILAEENAHKLLHKAALYTSERFVLKALMKANNNNELESYLKNKVKPEFGKTEKASHSKTNFSARSKADIAAQKQEMTPYSNLTEDDLSNVDSETVAISILSELEGRSPKAPVADEKIQQQITIIDNFIKASPSMSKLKDEPGQVLDLSDAKEGLDETLISENLAIILEKQGKYSKAVNIYKQLMLKIPEKKAYFANRIEKIKNA